MRPRPEGLLAILAAVAAAVSGCQGNADFSDAAPRPVILNADAYREAIMGIDRLVFEEKPLDQARRAALVSGLEGVARRTRKESDSRFVVLEALELRRLAEATRGQAPDAPRAALSREWMRIRSNLFDDRSWFARSAADLGPAASESPQSPR